MTEEKSLIEYPCLFPIKIVGKNNDKFITEIITVARAHFPDLKDSSIQTKLSNKENYISITITVYAENQASIDELYKALSGHPDVKMVL